MGQKYLEKLGGLEFSEIFHIFGRITEKDEKTVREGKLFRFLKWL